MSKDFVKSTTRRLFAFALVVLLLSQAAMSLMSWGFIQNNLLPEMDRKAATLGDSTRDRILYALGVGIPFDQLAGMESFFNSTLLGNDDIGYLAITTPEGRLIYHSTTATEVLQQHLGGIAPRLLQDGQTMAGAVIRTPFEAALNSGDTRQLGGVAAGYVDNALPLIHNGTTLGLLHVGVDEAFVHQRIEDIVFDIGIVMVTSLLFAFELLLFVSVLGLLGPMRLMSNQLGAMASGHFGQMLSSRVATDFGMIVTGLNERVIRVNEAFRRTLDTLNSLPQATRERVSSDVEATLTRLRDRFDLPKDGRLRELRMSELVDVRFLTFLFMFGEFLSRPFFPLYVQEKLVPIPGISEAMLMALPITAFMLTHVLTTPYSARLIRRYGARKAYIAGALLSTIGLIGTGMAFQMVDLVLWRVLSGAGYAVMFMACQAYVVVNTAPESRAQGISMFVGGLMAAEICAPAIGGILADRIGFQLVFILGAAVSLLSAGLALRQMRQDTPTDSGPQKTSDSFMKAFLALMRNPRFAGTVIFGAVPAKLLLTGFLFYLAPIYLTQLGSSQSEIGRYLMTYGLANAFLGWLFARWVDRWNLHVAAVAFGGLLTGFGLVFGALWELPLLVLAGIIALGVAQSITISAQVALISRLGAAEARIYGDAAVLSVFRLVERLGSAAGPFIVGLFVTVWGASTAMMASGILGLAAAALFMLVFLLTRSRPAPVPKDNPPSVTGSASA